MWSLRLWKLIKLLSSTLLLIQLLLYHVTGRKSLEVNVLSLLTPQGVEYSSPCCLEQNCTENLVICFQRNLGVSYCSANYPNIGSYFRNVYNNNTNNRLRLRIPLKRWQKNYLFKIFIQDTDCIQHLNDSYTLNFSLSSSKRVSKHVLRGLQQSTRLQITLKIVNNYKFFGYQCAKKCFIRKGKYACKPKFHRSRRLRKNCQNQNQKGTFHTIQGSHFKIKRQIPDNVPLLNGHLVSSTFTIPWLPVLENNAPIFDNSLITQNVRPTAERNTMTQIVTLTYLRTFFGKLADPTVYTTTVVSTLYHIMNVSQSLGGIQQKPIDIHDDANNLLIHPTTTQKVMDLPNSPEIASNKDSGYHLYLIDNQSIFPMESFTQALVKVWTSKIQAPDSLKIIINKVDRDLFSKNGESVMGVYYSVTVNGMSAREHGIISPSDEEFLQVLQPLELQPCNCQGQRSPHLLILGYVDIEKIRSVLTEGLTKAWNAFQPEIFCSSCRPTIRLGNSEPGIRKDGAQMTVISYAIYVNDSMFFPKNLPPEKLIDKVLKSTGIYLPIVPPTNIIISEEETLSILLNQSVTFAEKQKLEIALTNNVKKSLSLTNATAIVYNIRPYINRKNYNISKIFFFILLDNEILDGQSINGNISEKLIQLNDGGFSSCNCTALPIYSVNILGHILNDSLPQLQNGIANGFKSINFENTDVTVNVEIIKQIVGLGIKNEELTQLFFTISINDQDPEEDPTIASIKDTVTNQVTLDKLNSALNGIQLCNCYFLPLYRLGIKGSYTKSFYTTVEKTLNDVWKNTNKDISWINVTAKIHNISNGFSLEDGMVIIVLYTINRIPLNQTTDIFIEPSLAEINNSLSTFGYNACECPTIQMALLPSGLTVSPSLFSMLPSAILSYWESRSPEIQQCNGNHFCKAFITSMMKFDDVSGQQHVVNQYYITLDGKLWTPPGDIPLNDLLHLLNIETSSIGQPSISGINSTLQMLEISSSVPSFETTTTSIFSVAPFDNKNIPLSFDSWNKSQSGTVSESKFISIMDTQFGSGDRYHLLFQNHLTLRLATHLQDILESAWKSILDSSFAQVKIVSIHREMKADGSNITTVIYEVSDKSSSEPSKEKIEQVLIPQLENAGFQLCKTCKFYHVQNLKLNGVITVEKFKKSLEDTIKSILIDENKDFFILNNNPSIEINILNVKEHIYNSFPVTDIEYVISINNEDARIMGLKLPTNNQLETSILPYELSVCNCTSEQVYHLFLSDDQRNIDYQSLANNLTAIWKLENKEDSNSKQNLEWHVEFKKISSGLFSVMDPKKSLIDIMYVINSDEIPILKNLLQEPSFHSLVQFFAPFKLFPEKEGKFSSLLNTIGFLHQQINNNALSEAIKQTWLQHKNDLLCNTCNLTVFLGNPQDAVGFNRIYVTSLPYALVVNNSLWQPDPPFPPANLWEKIFQESHLNLNFYSNTSQFKITSQSFSMYLIGVYTISNLPQLEESITSYLSKAYNKTLDITLYNIEPYVNEKGHAISKLSIFINSNNRIIDARLPEGNYFLNILQKYNESNLVACHCQPFKIYPLFLKGYIEPKHLPNISASIAQAYLNINNGNLPTASVPQVNIIAEEHGFGIERQDVTFLQFVILIENQNAADFPGAILPESILSNLDKLSILNSTLTMNGWSLCQCGFLHVEELYLYESRNEINVNQLEQELTTIWINSNKGSSVLKGKVNVFPIQTSYLNSEGQPVVNITYTVPIETPERQWYLLQYPKSDAIKSALQALGMTVCDCNPERQYLLTVKGPLNIINQTALEQNIFNTLIVMANSDFTSCSQADCRVKITNITNGSTISYIYYIIIINNTIFTLQKTKEILPNSFKLALEESGIYNELINETKYENPVLHFSNKDNRNLNNVTSKQNVFNNTWIKIVDDTFPGINQSSSKKNENSVKVIGHANSDLIQKLFHVLNTTWQKLSDGNKPLKITFVNSEEYITNNNSIVTEIYYSIQGKLNEENGNINSIINSELAKVGVNVCTNCVYQKLYRLNLIGNAVNLSQSTELQNILQNAWSVSQLSNTRPSVMIRNIFRGWCAIRGLVSIVYYTVTHDKSFQTSYSPEEPSEHDISQVFSGTEFEPSTCQGDPVHQLYLLDNGKKIDVPRLQETINQAWLFANQNDNMDEMEYPLIIYSINSGLFSQNGVPVIEVLYQLSINGIVINSDIMADVKSEALIIQLNKTDFKYCNCEGIIGKIIHFNQPDYNAMNKSLLLHKLENIWKKVTPELYCLNCAVTFVPGYFYSAIGENNSRTVSFPYAILQNGKLWNGPAKFQHDMLQQEFNSLNLTIYNGLQTPINKDKSLSLFLTEQYTFNDHPYLQDAINSFLKPDLGDLLINVNIFNSEPYQDAYGGLVTKITFFIIWRKTALDLRSTNHTIINNLIHNFHYDAIQLYKNSTFKIYPLILSGKVNPHQWLKLNLDIKNGFRLTNPTFGVIEIKVNVTGERQGYGKNGHVASLLELVLSLNGINSENFVDFINPISLQQNNPRAEFFLNSALSNDSVKLCNCEFHQVKHFFIHSSDKFNPSDLQQAIYKLWRQNNLEANWLDIEIEIREFSNGFVSPEGLPLKEVKYSIWVEDQLNNWHVMQSPTTQQLSAAFKDLSLHVCDCEAQPSLIITFNGMVDIPKSSQKILEEKLLAEWKNTFQELHACGMASECHVTVMSVEQPHNQTNKTSIYYNIFINGYIWDSHSKHLSQASHNRIARDLGINNSTELLNVNSSLVAIISNISSSNFTISPNVNNSFLNEEFIIGDSGITFTTLVTHNSSVPLLVHDHLLPTNTLPFLMMTSYLTNSFTFESAISLTSSIVNENAFLNSDYINDAAENFLLNHFIINDSRNSSSILHTPYIFEQSTMSILSESFSKIEKMQFENAPLVEASKFTPVARYLESTFSSQHVHSVLVSSFSSSFFTPSNQELTLTSEPYVIAINVLELNALPNTTFQPIMSSSFSNENSVGNRYSIRPLSDAHIFSENTSLFLSSDEALLIFPTSSSAHLNSILISDVPDLILDLFKLTSSLSIVSMSNNIKFSSVLYDHDLPFNISNVMYLSVKSYFPLTDLVTSSMYSDVLLSKQISVSALTVPHSFNNTVFFPNLLQPSIHYETSALLLENSDNYIALFPWETTSVSSPIISMYKSSEKNQIFEFLDVIDRISYIPQQKITSTSTFTQSHDFYSSVILSEETGEPLFPWERESNASSQTELELQNHTSGLLVIKDLKLETTAHLVSDKIVLSSISPIMSSIIYQPSTFVIEENSEDKYNALFGWERNEIISSTFSAPEVSQSIMTTQTSYNEFVRSPTILKIMLTDMVSVSPTISSVQSLDFYSSGILSQEVEGPLFPWENDMNASSVTELTTLNKTSGLLIIENSEVQTITQLILNKNVFSLISTTTSSILYQSPSVISEENSEEIYHELFGWKTNTVISSTFSIPEVSKNIQTSQIFYNESVRSSAIQQIAVTNVISIIPTSSVKSMITEKANKSTINENPLPIFPQFVSEKIKSIEIEGQLLDYQIEEVEKILQKLHENITGARFHINFITTEQYLTYLRNSSIYKFSYFLPSDPNIDDMTNEAYYKIVTSKLNQEGFRTCSLCGYIKVRNITIQNIMNEEIQAQLPEIIETAWKKQNPELQNGTANFFIYKIINFETSNSLPASEVQYTVMVNYNDAETQNLVEPSFTIIDQILKQYVLEVCQLPCKKLKVYHLFIDNNKIIDYTLLKNAIQNSWIEANSVMDNKESGNAAFNVFITDTDSLVYTNKGKPLLDIQYIVKSDFSSTFKLPTHQQFQHHLNALSLQLCDCFGFPVKKLYLNGFINVLLYHDRIIAAITSALHEFRPDLNCPECNLKIVPHQNYLTIGERKMRVSTIPYFIYVNDNFYYDTSELPSDIINKALRNQALPVESYNNVTSPINSSKAYDIYLSGNHEFGEQHFLSEALTKYLNQNSFTAKVFNIQPYQDEKFDPVSRVDFFLLENGVVKNINFVPEQIQKNLQNIVANDLPVCQCQPFEIYTLIVKNNINSDSYPIIENALQNFLNYVTGQKFGPVQVHITSSSNGFVNENEVASFLTLTVSANQLDIQKAGGPSIYNILNNHNLLLTLNEAMTQVGFPVCNCEFSYIFNLNFNKPSSGYDQGEIEMAISNVWKSSNKESEWLQAPVSITAVRPSYSTEKNSILIVTYTHSLLNALQTWYMQTLPSSDKFVAFLPPLYLSLCFCNETSIKSIYIIGENANSLDKKELLQQRLEDVFRSMTGLDNLTVSFVDNPIPYLNSNKEEVYLFYYVLKENGAVFDENRSHINSSIEKERVKETLKQSGLIVDEYQDKDLMPLTDTFKVTVAKETLSKDDIISLTASVQSAWALTKGVDLSTIEVTQVDQMKTSTNDGIPLLEILYSIKHQQNIVKPTEEEIKQVYEHLFNSNIKDLIYRGEHFDLKDVYIMKNIASLNIKDKITKAIESSWYDANVGMASTGEELSVQINKLEHYVTPELQDVTRILYTVSLNNQSDPHYSSKLTTPSESIIDLKLSEAGFNLCGKSCKIYPSFEFVLNNPEVDFDLIQKIIRDTWVESNPGMDPTLWNFELVPKSGAAVDSNEVPVFFIQYAVFSKRGITSTDMNKLNVPSDEELNKNLMTHQLSLCNCTSSICSVIKITKSPDYLISDDSNIKNALEIAWSASNKEYMNICDYCNVSAKLISKQSYTGDNGYPIDVFRYVILVNNTFPPEARDLTLNSTNLHLYFAKENVPLIPYNGQYLIAPNKIYKAMIRTGPLTKTIKQKVTAGLKKAWETAIRGCKTCKVDVYIIYAEPYTTPSKDADIFQVVYFIDIRGFGLQPIVTPSDNLIESIITGMGFPPCNCNNTFKIQKVILNLLWLPKSATHIQMVLSKAWSTYLSGSLIENVNIEILSGTPTSYQKYSEPEHLQWERALEISYFINSDEPSLRDMMISPQILKWAISQVNMNNFSFCFCIGLLTEHYYVLGTIEDTTLIQNNLKETWIQANSDISPYDFDVNIVAVNTNMMNNSNSAKISRLIVVPSVKNIAPNPLLIDPPLYNATTRALQISNYPICSFCSPVIESSVVVAKYDSSNDKKDLQNAVSVAWQEANQNYINNDSLLIRISEDVISHQNDSQLNFKTKVKYNITLNPAGAYIEPGIIPDLDTPSSEKITANLAELGSNVQAVDDKQTSIKENTIEESKTLAGWAVGLIVACIIAVVFVVLLTALLVMRHRKHKTGEISTNKKFNPQNYDKENFSAPAMNNPTFEDDYQSSVAE